MKTLRLVALCGTVLFGAAAGCGVPTDDLASAVSTVEANAVPGGNLALPEGEDRLGDQRGRPCMRSEVERLTEKLGLSSEQVALLQGIEQETRDGLAAIREQVAAGELTREQGYEAAHALRQEQKAKVLAILTAEQQAKFAELRAHHGRPFDLGRLTQFLGLSDEQVTKIKDVMTATKASIDEIRSKVEGGSLTADEARPQIKALMDEQLKAIKALLTAEQLEKLETVPAPGGPGGGGPGRPGPGAPPPPGGRMGGGR